jgi:hypothetical protein
MMDFGFGAFLEKLEAAFGKRATNVLLVLIACAVAATCVSIIFGFIKPILAFINKDWAQPNSILTFANSVQLGATVLSAAFLASYFIDAMRIKETNRKTEETLSRAEDIMELCRLSREDSWKLYEESVNMSRKALHMIVATRLIVEVVAKNAVEKGHVDQAEVDSMIGEILVSLDDNIDHLQAAIDAEVAWGVPDDQDRTALDG